MIYALLTAAFFSVNTAAHRSIDITMSCIYETEEQMLTCLQEELDMEGITEDQYNHSIITLYGDREYITDEEIRLMERCVMSEAGGCTCECQEAVATVILNRWQNPDKYPDNIIDVIMEEGQFSIHDNGKPTVSVRLAVHNAIVYYNTAVQDLPRQIYWFRQDKYHDFGISYCSIDNLYFSGSEDMVL